MALSAAPSERSAACCLNDKEDKEDIYSACTAQLHAGISRVELRIRSRVLAAVTLLTLCKYCKHKGSKNTGGFGCAPVLRINTQLHVIFIHLSFKTDVVEF